MRLLLEKSDTFGAIASFLCMAHCILTPFVIVALQAYAVNGYEINPFWWQNLDFILLLISLISVAYSAKNSNKRFDENGLIASTCMHTISQEPRRHRKSSEVIWN